MSNRGEYLQLSNHPHAMRRHLLTVYGRDASIDTCRDILGCLRTKLAPRGAITWVNLDLDDDLLHSYRAAENGLLDIFERAMEDFVRDHERDPALRPVRTAVLNNLPIAVHAELIRQMCSGHQMGDLENLYVLNERHIDVIFDRLQHQLDYEPLGIVWIDDHEREDDLLLWHAPYDDDDDQTVEHIIEEAFDTIIEDLEPIMRQALQGMDLSSLAPPEIPT